MLQIPGLCRPFARDATSEPVQLRPLSLYWLRNDARTSRRLVMTATEQKGALGGAHPFWPLSNVRRVDLRQ